jgi:hypothetical protein
MLHIHMPLSGLLCVFLAFKWHTLLWRVEAVILRVNGSFTCAMEHRAPE